jgi:cytoskeleton protein RodZ
VGKLTPIQVQHLIEIGAFLRQVREEQDVSLEQVTATTYVPLRMLRAIESGQVDILPEAVFVQGFIRRYADALGLDGIAVAKQFPVNPAAVEPDPAPIAADRPAPEYDDDPIDEPPARVEPTPIYAAAVPPAPNTDLVAQRMARRSPSDGIPGWLGVGFVALVIISIGITIGVVNRSPAPETTEETNDAIAPADPEPVVTAEPEPEPAAPAVPVAITLNATEAAWVSITVDGTLDYEGTLPAGTERSWEAQNEVVVITGNAGGITISHNGSDATPLGDRGQVAEQTYTPTGPAAN